MKVIFLDFDGVLNSAASFVLESRIRKKWRERHPDLAPDEHPYGPVNETLCHVCTSNFQRILDECPETQIVISSTWRNLFEMDWLKAKLQSYGIDSSKVIDKTPRTFRGFNSGPRGTEISMWLKEHPEVTDYVILDDNSHMTVHMHKFVQTSWDTGILLPHVHETIQRLKGEKVVPPFATDYEEDLDDEETETE